MANKNETSPETNGSSARLITTMRPKDNHTAGRMFTKRPINPPEKSPALRL